MDCKLLSSCYQSLPNSPRSPSCAEDLEAGIVAPEQKIVVSSRVVAVSSRETAVGNKNDARNEAMDISRDSQTLEPQYKVPTHFISQSHGIPVLGAQRFRLQQVYLWLAAILVACALPMLFAELATHREHVHVKTLVGHIDIRTRNCDVMFEASPFNASDIVVRLTYWKMYGAGGRIETKNNGIAVKVSRSSYSSYFRCEALIQLPKWSTISSLAVRTFGGDAVLVQSSVPFHVAGVAMFKFHEAHAKLVGLHAAVINAKINEGVLDFVWDDTRKGMHVKVNTTKAPVFMRSSHTAMELKCSASTKQWVSASGVKLQPKPEDKLSTHHAIQIEAESAEAPVVLSCINCFTADEYVGSKHQSPGLAPISLESISKAQSWIKHGANGPWVLYLNVIGANLPQGRWMLLSSSVYLALPLHFFAIFSMGILAPEGLQVNVYPLGLHILNAAMNCERSEEDPDDMFEVEMLYSNCSSGSRVAQEIASIFELLWNVLEDKGIAPHHPEVLVWQPVNGDMQSMTRVKGALSVETDFFACTWMLVVATCTSIIGSLLASIYLLILAKRLAVPWLMGFNAEQIMSTIESQRLLHALVGARWKLVVGVVNSPEHGVLIKWSATSQQHHFTGILVSVKGRKGDSEHTFSFYANRSHLITHRQHSGMLGSNDEFMFQLLVTCAKQTSSTAEHPAHKRLRLGYQYSFCLHGTDATNKVIETSTWSSEVCVMPPTSAFDVPTMLINAFFPKQLESLDLFIDEYGKIESMQMMVGITDVELILNDEPLYQTCRVVVQWKGWDAGKQKFVATYRKDPSKISSNEQNLWYEGFIAETQNIFGKSVKEVSAARGCGMEHIMDVGTAHTINGNQRIARAQVLLERTDMEQTELIILLEHERGGQIAHGKISYKQLINRWGDQLSPFAKLEPLEFELDGATVRCNVLVGESSRNMLHGPESAFDTVVPNEIWYHGEEKMMGWDKVLLATCLEDLGFDKNIIDLPKDCVVVFTLAARSAGRSIDQTIFGYAESKLWGEYELDFEKLSLHVPALNALEGWFQVGMDTVWIQKKSDLPRLRGIPDKYPGHERRKKGFRWANVHELYSKGVIWERQGNDYVQKNVDPGKNAQRAFSMLSTHKLQILRPVLVQDFELAYASWCSAHRLAMGRVTESSLENSLSRVSVTEVQLKVCSGLRPALPFETPFKVIFQEGCSFVSTSHLLLSDHDANRFGLTSGNRVIRSKVKQVQLMQGFRWAPRKWIFEPSLESPAGIVWSLKSRIGRQNRCIRNLIEFYGLLEAFFWFLIQVFLSMTPAVLCLGGVIWAQKCGLEYDPSYMMSSGEPTWMAPQWLLTPHEAFPRGSECIPLYIALGYVLIALPLMGYMLFGQYLVPTWFRVADVLCDIVHATIFIGVTFIIMLINFWVFLGSLLNSGKFLPLAIMIGSAIGMVMTQWNQLNSSRNYLAHLIEKHMEYFLDCAFDRLLKEFMEETLYSSMGTDEKRRLFQQAIVDEICDDVLKARMKSSEAKKKKREALEENDDAASNGDSASLSSSSADSEYAEEEDVLDNNQEDALQDEARLEKIKFERIFQQLNLRTPLAENIAECLEEPRQLALQALEERKEQLEVVEQRFLSPGSVQIAELYEERMEHLERAFVKVVKRSFDEDKLVDAISHFIDQVLPQLIFLQAQSHARDISRVRRAVRDKWPAEKKGGLKLDLKMKLSDSLASSSKSSGSSGLSLSRKSSQSQFSNEDIRGMTVYEFLCHKDIAIFPQLSQPSKEYDELEDMILVDGYSSRYCAKRGSELRYLGIDHLINVEGTPRNSEGRWKWGIQLITGSGKLYYALKVESSFADGNKVSHVTSHGEHTPLKDVRVFPVPRKPVKNATQGSSSAKQSANSASSRVELAVRRTHFGFAFWAAGRRCTELDFYFPADSVASLSKEEVVYIEVFGLQKANSKVRFREEPKDRLHLQGEDLDTFELQERITQKLNSHICKYIIKGAQGRKSVELRKTDVLRLLQDILEGCIWWEEFQRLVIHVLDIKIKPEALKAYWIDKTKDSLLMPIKDVAENIMWLTGKMLWPTAFVLMCRDRELFPEIFFLTEVLAEKDAKDIRLQVEDESKERLEDQLDMCERDPQRFKKEFSDIVKKMETEYFDQIKREISSLLRAKQADKMSLHRLREKEKQLKEDHSKMQERLRELENFVDSESDIDEDIKEHQNEYQQIINFGSDEDQMMHDQKLEIKEEKSRLFESIKKADKLVQEKRNALLVKTEMENFERKIEALKREARILLNMKSPRPSGTSDNSLRSVRSAKTPKVAEALKASHAQKEVADPGLSVDENEPANELARTEKAARDKHAELQKSFQKIFIDYKANKIELRQQEQEQKEMQEEFKRLRESGASEEEMDEIKEKLGTIDETISDMENVLRGVDLNNLIVLYPLRQLEFEMQSREESYGIKIWNADAMDDVIEVECWDEEDFCLTRDAKVQKSVKEWMLKASLEKLGSQKRDEKLANIQKEQIERPPNKGDIEHADDSVWKNNSKMFEYLWDKYAEKAPDRDAFTEEMISRQGCLPLLMDIFFDTMVLRVGLIETDVDASVDKEHLPESMQQLAENGDLFRITNRDEDNWKLKNHDVWKAQSGDLHLNAMSVETELFYGNCKLQQMGDGYYTNTATSQVWLRSSKTSFRVIRGIWFDAFVDICAEVGLPVDRTSGWILWNLVTSEELMRDENIDLIMCREMRLTTEARRILYRDEELSDPEGDARPRWMLKLTSTKMMELKGQGRRHPWADVVDKRKSRKVTEVASSSGLSIDVAKVTRLKEEMLILLGYESDTLLITLEFQEDPLSEEFKKVAHGELQWAESKEQDILSNSQTIDLIDPKTREKIGKVELEFELDNSYKGIFNALDFDETNKMVISQFEQQHLIAELSEKKAKSFGCRDDSAPAVLAVDEDEANLRARVKDWTWGFVDPQVVRQNLLKLLERAPFVSKLMFHTFLKAAHLDLPEKIIDEIWRSKLDETCPLTLRWGEEVIPVRGLVTIDDCWKKLTRHVKKAIYWDLDDSKKEQLRLKRGLPIGGTWFLPFYNVMMSSCRVLYGEEQLRELYNAERDEKTGLMPLEGIFNSIEKMGRPGLPYESFKTFISRLGLTVEESQIRSAFFFIDVNQMNCLNKKELLQCTLRLMKATLPNMLLQELQLTIECIVPHIIASLSILVCLFSFILLAFSSLTAGGDRNAAIQSILSVAAAYGIKKERNTNKDRLAEKAISWMEKLFGFKAKVDNRRAVDDDDD